MSIFMRFCFLALLLFLHSVSAESFVYENAEDGSTARWNVYDNFPAGASVSIVTDPDINSQVVSLNGTGTANGYNIGNTSSTNGGWNDLSRSLLTWNMRTSEDFGIYVAVTTSGGFRYLSYTSDSTSRTLYGGNYVRNGLGPGSRDGTWGLFERDLAADLEAGDPGNQLIAVQGIFVRGSIMIDNVELSDVLPEIAVYENGEDGSTARWNVYDNFPAGASVSIVTDPDINSQVVSLNGTGTANGYNIGNTSSTNGGWNDLSRSLLTWNMRTSEDFGIYVAVTTSGGFRYLSYTSDSTSRTLYGGNYVRNGLGPGSRDGTWGLFERDLAADLEAGDPGNQLIAVQGIFVRGSIMIDNVELARAVTVEISIPVANAGPDISLELGETVVLDGSASTAPNGNSIVRYSWVSVGGYSIGDDVYVEYAPSVIGVQPIRLTVTDDLGMSSSDEVSVVTTAGIKAEIAVYENGEDGSTARWNVYDNFPAGASVSIVTDPDINSQVVSLNGTGTANGYNIGNTSSTNGGWNDLSRSLLTWNMRTSEDFGIYVAVTTSGGFRYLSYTSDSTSRTLYGGNYVRNGLGPGSRDGTWGLFERDLAADLEAGDPGNQLIAVQGIFVRGSIMIDNVELANIALSPYGEFGLPPAPPELNP